jgi:uncharacterized protein (TIGR02246 family)
MRHVLLSIPLVLCAALPCPADEATDTAAAEIRQRLNEYLSAFNQNDASAVGAYWAAGAVSLNEETGDRVTGRDALIADFQKYFQASQGARLTGSAEHVRLLRPDVAVVDGETTLFTPDGEPTRSAFTAILVKESGAWLFESSQERDLPTPETPYAALRDLEWLVGDWRDQTDGVEVNTTVRWSPNQAFLIRSFSAAYEGGDALEGTQVIGWDPRAKQYRTWSFLSDGSFGEGAVSRSGDQWLIKMSHVQSDGSTAAATQVITLVDENTMRVDKIGETIDGAPAPSSEPVTVVRVKAAASDVETSEAAQ